MVKLPHPTSSKGVQPVNKKRQRWKPGDIVKIPLDDGEWGFGRVLGSPLVAFYDFKSNDIPLLEEIASKPIAFKIWVMKYAITQGDFQVLGNIPLSPDLLERPPFFIQDVLNGKLSITYENGEQHTVSRQDVEGMECAAVWEPEHVIDRLTDHFAGRPNKWVEEMKPK